MPYLSEMVGRPVTDANGERIGRLEDLIAARGDVAPPQIVALAIKRGSDLLLIPYEEAAALLAPAIPLLRSCAGDPPVRVERERPLSGA